MKSRKKQSVEQGVAPYGAQSAPPVNADVGRKTNMKHAGSYIINILGALILSGCSTMPDLYLKDEASGRIYGPLDTSRMTDRHIPEGRYMALYPMRTSTSVTRGINIEGRKTILLRLPGATNDIPQSEWNSFEKAFLLSPDIEQFSAQEPGSILWGKENGQDWALQIWETTPDRIVIIRLGRTLPPPLSITAKDVDTHKVLTKTIIDRLEVRQASLDVVIDAIQQHIPHVHNTPVVVIKLDVSTKQRSHPITLNLRKIRLMDAIHYVAEVSGSSYVISGNSVLVKEGVQQGVSGYPPQGVGSPER